MAEEQLRGPRQVTGIRQFIKENYREMYARWQEYSDKGFYIGAK